MSLKKSYAAVVSSSDSESESSLPKSTSDQVILRSRTSAPRVTDSKVSNCIDRSGKNKQWRSKLDNWGGTYSYIRVHRS